MRLPLNVQPHAPVCEADLNGFEQKLGRQLPTAYRRLLLLANGFSCGGGTLVYGIDDLQERNQTWEVEECAPGYIAIGDNSSGDVFMMSFDSSDPSIHVVGCGTMTTDEMYTIASSLESWMNSGCPS